MQQHAQCPEYAECTLHLAAALQGSNTAMSGVVTLLAAATLLARSGMAASYSRQLVFGAVAGESWDFMGSRRMLFDMSNGTSATAGLRLDLIDQVSGGQRRRRRRQRRRGGLCTG